MKRNATTAELTNIDQQEAKRLSRMQLEAIAQVAMREGLSKEQVAYEQWIDTQPIEEVLSWDEMGEEERKGWCLEHLGEDVEGIEEGQRGGLGERVKEGERVEEEHAVVEHCVEEERQDEAVGDLGESRWIAVRTVKEQLAHEALVVSQEENSSLSPAESCPAEELSPTTELSMTAEPSPTPEPQRLFRAGQRVWTATTTEDSETKNKPQCPPCARLKRTWTRCRGGPPCIECQYRGLSAEQCQSYDLLNRSRKNRQKKKYEVCKKSELENEGQKERGEDIMENGKEDTGGLKEVEVEVGRGSDAEEVAP